MVPIPTPKQSVELLTISLLKLLRTGRMGTKLVSDFQVMHDICSAHMKM